MEDPGATIDLGARAEGYDLIDARERACAERTQREHPELVALWQRALTLSQQTLTGTFAFSGAEERIPAWHLRFMLIGMTLRASKLALDAAVGGYYSECCALIRHIVESWMQAAYS